MSKNSPGSRSTRKRSPQPGKKDKPRRLGPPAFAKTNPSDTAKAVQDTVEAVTIAAAKPEPAAEYEAPSEAALPAPALFVRPPPPPPKKSKRKRRGPAFAKTNPSDTAKAVQDTVEAVTIAAAKPEPAAEYEAPSEAALPAPALFVRPPPPPPKKSKRKRKGPARTKKIASDTAGAGQATVEAVTIAAAKPEPAAEYEAPTKAALKVKAFGLPVILQDGLPSLLCLVLALGIWALGLPRIDPAGLTDYGLISILPWQIWVSLALLVIGFSAALTPRLAAGPLPFLHLIGLVAVLHATPPIVYGTLRYSWAWKHLGIVDFIQRHGTVDPVASFLPAYHNWPGLFLASAAVANALGLNSIELAQAVRFTSPVLTLLYMVALVPVFRRFTDDPRVIAAALWIFVTGNWIGQDYFSPQGAAYLLFLVVIGLCLGPLRATPDSIANPSRRTGQFGARLAAFISRGTEMPARPIGNIARAAYAAAALVLILAITATHQLTPVALILALAGLAAIGRLSIAYCIFAIVAEILWLLYFAAPFVMLNLAEQLAAFGEGVAAASERLVDITIVSPGRVWGVIAGRMLTASVGLAAIAGGLRRLSLGYRDGRAIVLTGAAFPLFANPYGGEILFRVYLFALPFLAFFAATMFFPSPNKGQSRIWRGLFAVLGFLAAFGFLLSNNGKDRQYRFTPDEVETAHWLYSHAPPGTLLIEGSRGYPSQFMNYENISYIPISLEKASNLRQIIDNPELTFARWLSDPKWKAGFVIITRSQKANSDAEGIMPVGTLERIEQELLASPRFIVVKATANARVFALHPMVVPKGAGAQRLGGR